MSPVKWCIGVVTVTKKNKMQLHSLKIDLSLRQREFYIFFALTLVWHLHDLIERLQIAACDIQLNMPYMIACTSMASSIIDNRRIWRVAGHQCGHIQLYFVYRLSHLLVMCIMCIKCFEIHVDIQTFRNIHTKLQRPQPPFIANCFYPPNKHENLKRISYISESIDSHLFLCSSQHFFDYSCQVTLLR